MTRTAGILLLALLGLASSGRSQQTERAFASTTCHVAFQHPGDWAVRADTGQLGDPCAFLIRPLAWDSLLLEADSVDLYTIALRVMPEGFEAALPRSAFARRNGAWVVLGRHDMESPAMTLTRRGWHAVWGTATIGCYRVEGGYAGLCEVPTALVGTDTRSVRLQGGPRSEMVFDRILATLEVHP